MSEKTKKAIFEWLIVIGAFCALGALCGLEKGTSTMLGFWKTIGISEFMILFGTIGLKCINQDNDED